MAVNSFVHIFDFILRIKLELASVLAVVDEDNSFDDYMSQTGKHQKKYHDALDFKIVISCLMHAQ